MALSTKSVLVVDDEPGLANLASEYLRRIDDEMSVTTATSASEALSLLENGGEFDCVVSDYNMAEMNGLEFLEAVREEYPSLPFILYTGKGSEEIASEAISAGVTDYLQKESGTDHYEVLANRIDNAISENRAKVELRRTGEKIEALHETAARAATCTDRTELCGLAVDAAEEILAFDLCDISLCEGSRLVPQAVSKGVPSDGYYQSTPVDADDSFAGRAYRQGESIRIDDLRTHEVAPAGSDYRSALTVPIDDHGVFQAVSREVGGFSDRDRELAELLLAHVSAALDRIESAERLRSERDKFAALFRNIPHAICVGSFEDGDPVVSETNPTFENVFGWDADDIGSRPVDDRIVPESDAAESEATDINERMRDGEHVSGKEVRRRTADGPRDFLLHTVGAPAEDVNGFVIYTDITEQKRRERELQRQSEHLDEFVSVLGDEVRDSLDAAAADARRLDASDSERAERIRAELDRIETRVDEALDLAERGRTCSDSTSASIPGAVEAAWERVETGDATLRTADLPPEVAADESRLERLFEGLFRDAVAHGSGRECDSASGPDSADDSDSADDPVSASNQEADASADPDDAVTVEVGNLNGEDGLYVAVEGTSVGDEGDCFERGDEGDCFERGDEGDCFDCNDATGEAESAGGLRLAEDVARSHGWSVRVPDDRDAPGGASAEEVTTDDTGPSESDGGSDESTTHDCRVEIRFRSVEA